jgi:hypothetical protein
MFGRRLSEKDAAGFRSHILEPEEFLTLTQAASRIRSIMGGVHWEKDFAPRSLSRSYQQAAEAKQATATSSGPGVAASPQAIKSGFLPEGRKPPPTAVIPPFRASPLPEDHMNKSVLTIAAIAALAMPESGMASALPRTGPEPTEAEMRAAVEGKTDAMKEHFQHLERPLPEYAGRLQHRRPALPVRNLRHSGRQQHQGWRIQENTVPPPASGLGVPVYHSHGYGRVWTFSK